MIDPGQAVNPANLLDAFVALLRKRHSPDLPMTLRIGVTAMLDFYEQQRVETESDTLLFQWGTYDFGEGPSFQFGIARQVERPVEGQDDDDDEEDSGQHHPEDDLELWQLQLTLFLPPSPRLKLLGQAARWCASPGELAAFREWISGTPLFQTLADETGVTFELRYECAE